MNLRKKTENFSKISPLLMNAESKKQLFLAYVFGFLFLAVGVAVLFLAFMLKANGETGDPYSGDISALTAEHEPVSLDTQCLDASGQPAPCAGLGPENGVFTTQENSDDNSILSDTDTDEAPDYLGTLDSSVSAEDSLASVSEGDPASVNLGTGAGSNNIAVNNTDNETDIINNNDAYTHNNSFLKASTGNNVANFNSQSGVITTEDASGEGELINVINKNIVLLPDGSEVSAQAVNDGTGAGSDNAAITNINNQLTVRNINNSNTINDLEAHVISGRNQAIGNTEHGMIITGDADLGLNFITMANTNLIGSQRFYANWQNVYGDLSQDVNLAAETAANLSPLSGLLVEASNNCTGAGSNNTAIVNVNDETRIINQNSGRINNEINAEVISGQNKANQNTGTGSIATGSVNSAVNVVNFLNSNITASNWWLKSLNVFGDWQGNIILPYMPSPNLVVGVAADVTAGNSGTGFGSDNDVDVNINDSTNVLNNNLAVITNNVAMATDTGSNQSSFNGKSGVVKFGQADAETNEVNAANINVTGDSWWMVVINKFGNWSGTTVGSPADMVVSALGDAEILSPLNSGITVGNNSTGPDSNNIAGANINHSTDILNANNADITNTLSIQAVSGQNETQFNTGHGYIDAGDIRATNNLVNFANSNITAGNWMVAVVNVFGDWSGNLVFGAPGSAADLSVLSSGDGSIASNSDTGTGSENSASVDNNNNNDAINNNNATNNNNTSSVSTTGDNSASGNTGNGVVATGGASAGSSVANESNTNEVGVGGNGNGDSASGNAGTGAGSLNDSSIINTDSNTSVANNNVVSNNNLGANNNTGGNASDFNTGNGVVDTGWADTFVGLYNQNNDNQITLGEVVDEVSGVPVSDDNNQNSSDYDQNSTNIDAASAEDNAATNQSNGNYQALSGSVGASGSSFSPIVPVNDQQLADSGFVLKGDLNHDGKVDDYDFSLLMANWGKKISDTKIEVATADDAVVDDRIFSLVMANWNKTLASLN
jgi:hypothetical protein